MLKRLYGKEDVPQEVADQLAEMVFIHLVANPNDTDTDD
jgi:hypothetical protein